MLERGEIWNIHAEHIRKIRTKNLQRINHRIERSSLANRTGEYSSHHVEYVVALADSQLPYDVGMVQLLHQYDLVCPRLVFRLIRLLQSLQSDRGSVPKRFNTKKPVKQPTMNPCTPTRDQSIIEVNLP